MGRRGRPTQPTVKRAIPGGLGCEYRVAWMLRVNRLYGEDERLSVGSVFARAFRGGSWGRDVDGPQINRWELVKQHARYPEIRRYEELLGLPRNALVAVADFIYRETRGTPGPPHLRRPLDPYGIRLAWLGDLTDRALSTDSMDGDDWDTLTADLDAVRSVLPVKDPGWVDIVERLAMELVISEAGQWVQRNEAMVRFIGDPVTTPLVIAVCAGLSSDPRSQVASELLGMLEITPHSDAITHLVRGISAPANELARRGAWWAAAEKTSRGHLRPSDVIRLVQHARSLLSGRGGHPDCRSAAAHLLHQLPHVVSPALMKSLRLHEADDTIRNVLTSGRIVGTHAAAVTVKRIADAVLGRMPRERLSADPVLAELLGDALFGPTVSPRLSALTLMRATPYRIPVAEVLSMELDRQAVRADPELSAGIVRAVTYLGSPAQRQPLERLALAADRLSPRSLAMVIHALAHCGGSDSSNEIWGALIARHLLSRAGPPNPHVADGIVYALGIQRRFASLRGLYLSPAVPGPVRAAASWWLNLPEHVLRSTAR